MFGKDKGAAETKAPGQLQRSAVANSTALPESPETVSSISSGMTITGKIVGEGALRIFGRIEGELKASSILIADGAQVEGDIVAQEVTNGGHVKGTIHANRVTLHSSSFVEGDIFHRSLTIEENARFEGASRREDNVADAPPKLEATTSNPQPAAQPQIALTDGNRKLNGPPDNMESYQSAT